MSENRQFPCLRSAAESNKINRALLSVIGTFSAKISHFTDKNVAGN